MGRMEAVGRFIRAAVYNIRIKGVRRCFARALNTAAAEEVVWSGWQSSKILQKRRSTS